MSKIWDALRKAEEVRGGAGTPTVLPYRVQLTPKQRSAVEALLATDSLDEAVQICGVKEATLRRWMAQPSFVGAYYAAGCHQLRDSLHRLRATTGEAVDVLRKGLGDADAAVRIQAALAILQGAALRDPDRGAAPPPPADEAEANAQRKKVS